MKKLDKNKYVTRIFVFVILSVFSQVTFSEESDDKSFSSEPLELNSPKRIPQEEWMERLGDVEFNSKGSELQNIEELVEQIDETDITEQETVEPKKELTFTEEDHQLEQHEPANRVFSNNNGSRVSAFRRAQPSELMSSLGGNAYYINQHKLTASAGYDEPSIDGGSDTKRWSLRYDLYTRFYFPSDEWPNFILGSRLWLTSSKQDFQSATSDAEVQEGDTEDYLEYRELFIEKQRLFGYTGLSLRLGRSQIQDTYGLWWDTSIEQVRLNLNTTYQKGMFAIAKRFSKYRTGIYDSSSSEDESVFGLGEYSWIWKDDHTLGVRFVGEHDDSPLLEDNSPHLKGWRYGIFAEGTHFFEQKNIEFSYAADLKQMRGNVRLANNDIDLTAESIFAQSKIKWKKVTYQPSLTLLMALTTKPSDNLDLGYFPNYLESNRQRLNGQLSSGLTGNSIRFRMQNAEMFGTRVQIEPSARNLMSVAWYRVNRQSESSSISPLLVSGLDLSSDSNTNLADIYDLAWGWSSFPKRKYGKLFTIQSRLNVSYLSSRSESSGLKSGFHLNWGVDCSF